MSQTERNSKRLIFVKDIYVSGAVFLANTIMFLVLANVILAGFFFVRDFTHPISKSLAPPAISDGKELFKQDGSPIDNGKRTQYQFDWVDIAAYESIPEGYVAEVLDDFSDLGRLGFASQPWVHFSEPLFAGKRVHVLRDPLGFPIRLTVNPPNKDNVPVLRIYVLGGSTTFGYNVSDEHTFPTHLSTVLNERAKTTKLGVHVEVTNYARGFYYPSQETALLVDLLRMGHRPNIVVFLDGVNPGSLQDLPDFYERFERRFRSLQFFGEDMAARTGSRVVDRLEWIPMVRLVQAIQNRMLSAPKRSEENKEEEKEKEFPETKHLVNIFLQNQILQKAVCQAYRIHCVFFLQPNAILDYPADLYRRALPRSFMKYRELVQPVYKQMLQDKQRIYLGDLFQTWGKRRKAIVDDVHYSPGFNRFLAEHVAGYLNLEDLVPISSGIIESEATGTPRTSR